MENPPLYSFVYFMLPYFSTCSSTCQGACEHLFVFRINEQIFPLLFVRPAQKEKPHVSERDMELGVYFARRLRARRIKYPTHSSRFTRAEAGTARLMRNIPAPGTRLRT